MRMTKHRASAILRLRAAAWGTNSRWERVNGQSYRVGFAVASDGETVTILIPLGR